MVLIHASEPLVAAAILVALAPILLAVAVVIAVLARRSPLVRHVRVGRHGTPLPLLKFRTMWSRGRRWAPIWTVEPVTDYVPERKSAPDPRVTNRFAAWCRRHSVDELPQLFHVVCGEMSFVGPRPITRAEFDKYYLWNAGEVLSAKPGLVGLWQVLGRNELSYAQRRRLDLFLVRHGSAALRFRILWGSLWKVISGSGAY
jgi:lipopolysaccharide/colanic/teichoic acid biosynthesis glycosyltransferase